MVLEQGECVCPDNTAWEEDETSENTGSCVDDSCPATMPFKSPMGCHASCDELNMDPMTRFDKPFECYCKGQEVIAFDLSTQ